MRDERYEPHKMNRTMNDVEYYRMKRLVPRLQQLAKEYPMRTLDNVIRNLDDRLNYYKECKTKKSK